MNKLPILIDTDPGIDDLFCIAIGCAFSDVFDLKALTTIGGNNTTAVTTRNALNILKLFKREDVAVAKGADSFLKEPFGEPVAKFHGHNGIGDVTIEDSPCQPSELSASEMIYKCAREEAGQLVIVTVGPETNLAVALQRHPDLKDLVKKIVVMGGSLTTGNISPYAEANIGHDAYAADIVFSSGIPIDMVGLDITRKAPLKKEIFADITDADERIKEVMLKLIEFRNEESMHDAIAISSLVDKDIIGFEPCNISIVTEGERKGQTVTDKNGPLLHRAAVSIDIERYQDLMREMLIRL